MKKFLKSIVALYYMRKIREFEANDNIINNWCKHHYSKPDRVYIIRIGFDTVDLRALSEGNTDGDTLEDFPICELLTLKKFK